jgi:hypothetical protein
MIQILDFRCDFHSSFAWFETGNHRKQQKTLMVGAEFAHQVRISNIPAVSETACSP